MIIEIIKVIHFASIKTEELQHTNVVLVAIKRSIE